MYQNKQPYFLPSNRAVVRLFRIRNPLLFVFAFDFKVDVHILNILIILEGIHHFKQFLSVLAFHIDRILRKPTNACAYKR